MHSVLILAGVLLQHQVNGKTKIDLVASPSVSHDCLCPPPTQELRDLDVYPESSGSEFLISRDINT